MKSESNERRFCQSTNEAKQEESEATGFSAGNQSATSYHASTLPHASHFEYANGGIFWFLRQGVNLQKEAIPEALQVRANILRLDEEGSFDGKFMEEDSQYDRVSRVKVEFLGETENTGLR